VYIHPSSLCVKVEIRNNPILVIWYAKLYLLGLFLFIHLYAALDKDGIPYFPIELSALIATYYTRKAIFLAGVTPISLLFWTLEAENWPYKGIGVSLFLMTVFDVANEWPLHLLCVCAFNFCLYQNNKESRLFVPLVCLYGVKSVISLACSGYIPCGNALFIGKGVLQWCLFILLSRVI